MSIDIGHTLESIDSEFVIRQKLTVIYKANHNFLQFFLGISSNNTTSAHNGGIFVSPNSDFYFEAITFRSEKDKIIIWYCKNLLC